MNSDPIGLLLKQARKHLGLSRRDLADRAQVSMRLVAELERGERPNVSLETALRLLNLVGSTVTVVAATGESVVVGSEHTAHLARLARAHQRRATWTGRQVPLHEAGNDPQSAHMPARLVAVAELSRHVYALSDADDVRESEMLKRETDG